MDAITVTFLAIGGLAVLLMLLSLVGGHLHVGHLHVGHVHLGHLHIGGADAGHGGGELTLPSIAGFVGAFGFGGAVVASLLRGYGSLTVLAATAAGLVVAVPAGWLGGRLTRAAMDMPTDATPTSADLIGACGMVTSDVPAGGYGEVRLFVAGSAMKLYARADEPLGRGTEVFVIEVPTPTSVLVVPLHLKEE
jgi:membrane protein implicated in regulation of membrane protease activity